MSQYTVKQVAALTGVPAATLRVWERRYEVVSPARTPAGYRLYDDGDVARLTRMAQLIAEGTPASLAAHQLGPARPEPPFGRRATPASRRPDHGGPPNVDGLVQAARTLDADLLDAVLADAFARGSFESVVEDWLVPALRAIGDAWDRGEVDVAGEHFVSASVARRLATWFEAAPVRPGSPIVLVGLPAGASHQLGALAFATCLRRQGVDVRYLGADLPHDSWVQATQTLRPDAVVVSVPLSRDAEQASRTASALAALTTVFVGGGGAEAMTPLPPGVEQLENSVTAAAADVAEALHA
ncbi:MAG: MerR family transcriptional regulator [Actinomycetes bacterium]